LIEAKESRESYSMHPVVQDWCHEYLNRGQHGEFILVALASISYAVPESSNSPTLDPLGKPGPTERQCWVLQQRLLPHANQILNFFQKGWLCLDRHDKPSTLDMVHTLGRLYHQQGKPVEAEAMYQGARAGYEEMLGLEVTSMLEPVNNLGLLSTGKQDGRTRVMI
jgi:hypothetical protein